MQWSSDDNAGFTSGKPWLPLNKNFKTRSVEVQRDDPNSLFSFYRQLITLRKATPALQTGRWVPLVGGLNGIIAYSRIHGDDRILVILNFNNSVSKLTLSEHAFGQVLFSTHHQPGERFYFQNFPIQPFEVTICES